MLVRKKNIIWLASYPKSGNTWFRLFLSYLYSDSEDDININQLDLAPIASSRSLIDQYLGINTSNLTMNEIEIIRPKVYRKISDESENEVFLKTHDAWKLNSDGESMFPPDVTKGVLYFVRNPLDVAVSFAFHSNTDFAKTIQHMNDDTFGFCMEENRLFNQLSQQMFSWSGHVNSWVHHSKLPVHVMRYEDMLHKPFLTFTKALDFLNIKYSKTKVNNALYNCSFDKLTFQEEKFGFKEKTINSLKFFRSGTMNDWQKHLKKHEVNQIIKMHRSTMESFGYLNDIQSYIYK
ncbi:MAG: sulfotransferase domain-containing protein [Bacteroidales bacterium]|nr:sulfotransferase domain-containing protein [Bacteroidales bacterium]